MPRDRLCVVVVLSGGMATAVEKLWTAMWSRWGLRPSHPASVPHLTLATVKGGSRRQLLSALAAVAAESTPFCVTGAGFGVFAARGTESAIVHLALSRTPQLSALHERVVEGAGVCGGEVDGQTRPQFWQPHITLADTRVTPAMVGDIMGYLARHGPKHWTAQVDNISVMQPEGSVRYRFVLGEVATLSSPRQKPFWRWPGTLRARQNLDVSNAGEKAEADPADVQDQQRTVTEDEEDEFGEMVRRSPDTPEADAWEQALEVMEDEDEQRR